MGCEILFQDTLSPPKLAYKINMLKIEYLHDIGKRSVDNQAVFTVDHCQIRVMRVIGH